MSTRHALLLALSAALMSCAGGGGTPPDTTLQTFFASQPSFDGPLPPGTTTVTPGEFMTLVQGGATVVTTADLQAAVAAEAAQNAQDDADSSAYIGQYPEFRNLLDTTPAADHERLVAVDVAGKAKPITLMGHQFGRAALATHARTFGTRDNQARLYTELYPDLEWALEQQQIPISQFGLPGPGEIATLDAAHLALLNQRIGSIAAEYRSRFADLKYLIDPASAEIGSADQLDRTQTGSCKPAAAGGIYRNFGWPLKASTTSVKDQGQRGTCWDFATIAALEIEIARRDHMLVNLSEQDYAGHRFLEWAPRSYGDGGDPILIAQRASAANYVFPYEQGWQYNKSSSRSANDTTQTYSNSCTGYTGVCSDTNYQGYLLSVPYLNKSTGQLKTYVIRSLPETGHLSGYRMQDPSDFWEQDNLTRSMAILLLRSVLGHPTTITLDMRYVKPTANAAPSMNNMNPDANGFVPTQTKRTKADGTPDWELDHVMTVTGFISSDHIRQGLPGQTVADDYGYFIVKNSWGDCWGDQGYVYLPWTWIQQFVGQASTGILPQ